MINYKSNIELLEALNSHVTGHLTAKKALINLIKRSKIRHFQKWIAHEHKDFLIPPGKCLLIGASGTGKTFLVESLQKIIDFPLLKIDATRMTITSAGDGIKSGDIDGMVYNNAVRYQAMRNLKGYTNSIEGIIDQTVVFIDEVDKLAWGTRGQSDAWNKRTQANFLQIFENSDYLSSVSFIFAGAFADMERSSTDKKHIGFGAKPAADRDEDMLDELVVKYGLIPELVGRISSIVELDKFSREDYKNILLKVLVPVKLEELIYFNCADFHLTDEQIENILDRAVNSGQGVRFLKRELDKLLLDIEFNHETIQENHSLLLNNLIDKYGADDAN